MMQQHKKIGNLKVWEYNFKDDTFSINNAWAEALGYRLDELVAMNLETYRALIHPDDFAQREKLLQKNPPSYEIELRLESKNGEWIWFCESGAIDHYMQDGKPLSMSGEIFNIHQYKQSELQLQESQNLLSNIINEMPDVFVLKDEKGDFLLCNQTVANLYKTTPQEMIGKNDGDFGVSKEQNDFFKQNVLSIMQRGETEIVYEDSTDATTGEVHHFRSIKKPLKDSQGKNQILVIAQDITEVVRANEKVAQNEQRLRDILEATKEGIWDWNIVTGEVIHNSQWYKALGYEEDELENTAQAFIARIHPQDKNSVWQRVENHLSGITNEYYSEHRMLSKNGTVIWVQDRGRVVEYNKEGSPVRMVGSFSDTTLQKSHEEELNRLANFDHLTNLPNRHLLSHRLNQAIMQTQKDGSALIVLFIDLDSFKEVNDRHGHDVGDMLLQKIATKMHSSLRQEDTLARIGGDEFVAVLKQNKKSNSTTTLLNKLLAIISSEITIGEHTFKVSASIGATFYSDENRVDADQLLRQADQAMYQAKLSGKNCFHIFDTYNDTVLREHHKVIHEIEDALQYEEFELYYQPKVNLLSSAPIGLEALIRWNHPTKGLLSPALFLPDIEHHELSIFVGEWVIKSVLERLKQLAHENIFIPISVNITANHFQQENFVERIEELLSLYPEVNPALLEIEILETSVIQDIDYVVNVIKKCTQLGIEFALDDFGTGFSSLSYLKQLPVQTIKIDQTFVRDMLTDPEDAKIISGILGLADAFEKKVIAEGVEYLAHQEALLKLGCFYAQGYSIARPMPASEIASWIKERI